MIARG